MEMDLHHTTFTEQQYKEYIYGSAEVVGLMCLTIFTHGDKELYNSLLKPARKLGEAFQKVNFLRDIQSDSDERGRFYFPGVEFSDFDAAAKQAIENEIQNDFDLVYEGIKRLPIKSRLGVYLAYFYYLKLFDKIKKANAQDILQERFRISNRKKMIILLQCYFRNKLGYIK